QHHTRAFFGWRHRTHTHTHTHSEEVAVKCILCIYPILGCPSSIAAKSSGQLVSARGPSESSVLVRDGQECSVLFACFFCWGFLWWEPVVCVGWIWWVESG